MSSRGSPISQKIGTEQARVIAKKLGYNLDSVSRPPSQLKRRSPVHSIRSNRASFEPLSPLARSPVPREILLERFSSISFVRGIGEVDHTGHVEADSPLHGHPGPFGRRGLFRHPVRTPAVQQHLPHCYVRILFALLLRRVVSARHNPVRRRPSHWSNLPLAEARQPGVASR